MSRPQNSIFIPPLFTRLGQSGMVLAIVLLLGFGLRLWHLDLKPLWLDEVLTAIFTMGRGYQDVPLNQFFPLTALDQVFTVQPGLSCADITQRITTESVHPPVFFCLLYRWMSWLNPQNWVWAMRFLPALFGVGAIAAMYWLNRVAFSTAAGLRAAALMAVSPFTVYLSQEARHYTLPMLLITLTLAFLVQMQQDVILQKRLRPLVWTSWVLLNSLALYTHYFCLLSLIAQIAALTGWLLWNHRSIARRYWIGWGLAISAIGLSYLPWLPTMISHFSRPETDWLIPYKPDWLDRLEPLYQTLVGWTLMVIALPVEGQPNWIVIPVTLLIIGFMLWFVWQLRTGWQKHWQNISNRPGTLLIAGFTACILLQFFAIVYLLNKDLTVVPRYNFIYYPSVCALLGACFTSPRAHTHPLIHPFTLTLIAGLLSSIFVVNGLVFQKSYHPDQVAQNMAFEPEKPLAVVVNYRSPQEVALGLSFALALRQQYPPETIDQLVRFAFVDRSEGYSEAWKKLSQIEQSLIPPLNLWVVASPGMRTKDYPQQLTLNAPSTPGTRPKMRCLVGDRLYRQGFPYQLYRCRSLDRK